MPPHIISENISNLSKLGYKNTQLVAKIREKMLASIQGTDILPEKSFDIHNAIYGEKSGRTERYSLYNGFKDSKEFYSHVETLLNWKTEDSTLRKAKFQVQNIKGEEKETYLEIVQIMEGIINTGKQVKSIQSELAEAIEAVRSQFSKMASVYDQTEFMKNNKYIKYDLLELQERLVESGLMTPDEAIGRKSYEKVPFNEKMDRAKELFYDLTKDYYPEMVPITDHLLDPVNTTHIRENISLLEKEQQNELNLKYIGLILGGLSEMSHSTRRDDVAINEYFKEK